MSRHFVQNSLIRRVHAYLAVTSQLHFWQNDQDFVVVVRATLAVIPRGSNGYQNKSQHIKLNLEKKSLPHESSALTTELSPLPDGFLPAFEILQRYGVDSVLVRLPLMDTNYIILDYL